MEKQNAWVRVAGNAAKIKASDAYGWRCYFAGEAVEIPLRDWVLNGIASRANFIPGFSAEKDEHGLVAWIDCFGSCVMEDDVLCIDLQEPST